MTEEVPLGGNMSDTRRVGERVLRRAGPWTPAVHGLLRHLADAGFDAPIPVGIDEEGHEVLRYLDGEAYAGTAAPLPPHLMNDDNLVAAARLLRRYHAHVVDFRPPAGARWRLVAPPPHELICHNDWAPWNALLRSGRVAAMLDWDLAGPGSRMWDVANAAYCWAPLFDAHGVRSSLDEKRRRLRLFVDAYGILDRAAILPTLRTRLRFVGAFIEREALAGDPGMRRLAAAGVVHKISVADVAFLDEHLTALEAAL